MPGNGKQEEAHVLPQCLPERNVVLRVGGMRVRTAASATGKRLPWDGGLEGGGQRAVAAQRPQDRRTQAWAGLTVCLPGETIPRPSLRLASRLPGAPSYPNGPTERCAALSKSLHPLGLRFAL